MKLCPKCRRNYPDETLNYCLDDGSSLVYGSNGEIGVRAISKRAAAREVPTQIFGASAAIDTERSIAVLPFANMSGDAENEYFCDGLAEELLNSLSNLDGLKVAARTSSFSFKNTNSKVADVGHALNVANVLEGSVRRSGERLRITVQLVNAVDGYHIWSERYDREMKDVFEIQDDITLAVVAALKLKLFDGESPGPKKRGTESTEAYEAYLKGLFYHNKFGVENVKAAIEYFEKAVAIDPNFALAYAHLSESSRLLVANGTLDPRAFRQKAEEWALRALTLDPELADAHLALAAIRLDAWKFSEAKREVERAIALSPNHPSPRILHAFLLSILGHPDEAVDEVKLARDLDPLSRRAVICVGWILYTVRRFDEAIKTCQRTLELDPSLSPLYFYLGSSYTSKGLYKEAIASYEKAISLDRAATGIYIYQAALYVISGDRQKGEQLINELTSRADYISPGELALYYVATGDHDRAVELLNTAFDEHDPQLQFVGFDPLFDAIRSDPRFIDLIRRIGLPSPAEKS